MRFGHSLFPLQKPQVVLALFTDYEHLNFSTISSSTQHLNSSTSTNVAFMSTELDLGKLNLTLAKSELEVRSTTTALFSRPNTQDDASGGMQLDLCTLERSWVQRGRGLQLQLQILVEGKPLSPALVQNLINVLCKAKVCTLFCCSFLADLNSYGHSWASKRCQSPQHKSRQNAPARKQLDLPCHTMATRENNLRTLFIVFATPFQPPMSHHLLASRFWDWTLCDWS